LTITSTTFEKIYRSEKNTRVRERMLLVLNVLYYNKVATHVAREIHRSKGWASQWLKRYREEGMEGLKDRPKDGRHPKISRQTEYRIKTILKENNQQGWTTKQVEKMIIKESGIKYHHNYIYCILCRWGFKQKVPRKVHVNTASAEEKEYFKKRSARYLWVQDTKRKTLT
jgi:putative transposase